MTNASPPADQRGIISLILRTVATLFFFLLFSLFFSILSEWIGMTFWWPDEKVLHAKQMFLAELSYLNSDFKDTLFGTSSMEFARGFSDKFYYYTVEFTGLFNLMEWASKPLEADASGTRTLVHNIYMASKDYVVSTLYTTQTFAVRLSILVMAMPTFAIFFIVGLTEGLVRRDIRRWSGGRESSLVYSYSKMAVIPTFLTTWLVYLAMPVSIHPNFIILPFAVLSGLSLMVMATTFKKYI